MTDTTDTAAPAAYSEKQAADVLGIPRSRLASLRVQGRLAVPVTAPEADAYGYVGRTAAYRYDAAAIDAAAAGERELLVSA